MYLQLSFLLLVIKQRLDLQGVYVDATMARLVVSVPPINKTRKEPVHVNGM